MSKYEDSVKKFEKWNEESHLMYEKNKDTISDEVMKKYSDKLSNEEMEFLTKCILFVNMFPSDTKIENNDIQKLNEILEKTQ